MKHCRAPHSPFDGAWLEPGWLTPHSIADNPTQLSKATHMFLLQCSFYTRVLGMKQLPRPPFPFDGAWLEAGGLTLHLIADDPTIPRKEARKHWKACFYPGALPCCVASTCPIANDPTIPESP